MIGYRDLAELVISTKLAYPVVVRTNPAATSASARPTVGPHCRGSGDGQAPGGVI
jgi:hypothetical protein